MSELTEAVERLPQLVNGDPWLVHRGRFVSVDFLIELSEVSFLVTIEHGHIVALDRGALLMRPWRFAIRGGEEGWRRFWQPIPPPGYHDILALTKLAEFRIEGELHPFMANLLYFKAVLEAPRRLFGSAEQ
jgi:hypothetical protein